MTEPTLDVLTQRLDRLERENRWWRFGAFGTLAAAALLILVLIPQRPAAAPVPSLVEAQRIVIRDPGGKVRAVLGVETPQRGWPQLPASLTKGEKQYQPPPELGLFLYGPDGVEVARLTDWGGAGALLALADREQQGLAKLMALRGIASLEVSARKGKELSSVVQDMEAVFKRAEREHWTPDDSRWKALPSLLGTSATVKAIGGHGPLISGFEATGDKDGGLIPDVRVALYGSGIARPGLYLMNGPTSIRAKLQLNDDGSPRLELLDANNRARAVLGRTLLETIRTGESVDYPESSLVLFDKDGKLLWRAP
jgi:hypothetical protein